MNDLIHKTTEDAQHSSNLIGVLLIGLLCTCCLCLFVIAFVSMGSDLTPAEMWLRIVT